MTKRHTDMAFEDELRRVRENLLEMAGLVEDMIDQSVKAFGERDLDLADQVIENDRLVNRLELDTDDLCLVILAKRQPVASDLRFITLAMKMVTDLERIGDLAVNICERARELDVDPRPEILAMITRMSEAVRAMVRDSIDAFVEGSAKKAETVFGADDEVDDLFTEVCTVVQTRMHDNPETVTRGIHQQAVAKFLERIGDHATNLAEMVVFMIRGTDIRHAYKS